MGMKGGGPITPQRVPDEYFVFQEEIRIKTKRTLWIIQFREGVAPCRFPKFPFHQLPFDQTFKSSVILTTIKKGAF